MGGKRVLATGGEIASVRPGDWAAAGRRALVMASRCSKVLLRSLVLPFLLLVVTDRLSGTVEAGVGVGGCCWSIGSEVRGRRSATMSAAAVVVPKEGACWGLSLLG